MPVLSFAQSPISKEIAPTGKLRVALNAGGAIMLTRASDGTISGGVGPGLAKFFCGEFGSVVELVAIQMQTHSHSPSGRVNGILALDQKRL
jgi:hypothetical protein